jgi:hypothetical protein
MTVHDCGTVGRREVNARERRRLLERCFPIPISNGGDSTVGELFYSFVEHSSPVLPGDSMQQLAATVVLSTAVSRSTNFSRVLALRCVIARVL